LVLGSLTSAVLCIVIDPCGIMVIEDLATLV
jgi:hypothetical protein